jgi:molybdopterin molybdotransferase
MSDLLPFAAALERLLAGVEALPAQAVSIDQCAGRVLAQPLLAHLTQPPFAAGAMDGYAIRWADLHQSWRGVGESAAGPGWPDTLAAGASCLNTACDEVRQASLPPLKL